MVATSIDRMITRVRSARASFQPPRALGSVIASLVSFSAQSTTLYS